MNTRETMRDIMQTAWTFVKRNGLTISEALKIAWRNFKLQVAMKSRVVEFWYKKATTGELRQAFGTTDPSRYDYTPTGNGHRGPYADCVQYWDTAKGAFRMFKTYNLKSVVL